MKKFFFNVVYYCFLPVGFVHEVISKVRFGKVEWEDTAASWTYMFVQSYLIDYVEE